ncbi:MAG: DNA-formamidopyrimidine glycosylase [Patescibacteria group bacterium]|jgi:formamidopyrimidine-DNA glycosylase
MPELPEVETLRRELASVVRGKTIKSASVDWPKMVKPLTPKQFSQQLKGRKIIDVKRRAKILIIELSSDNFLLIHLKLTGQLIFRNKKSDIRNQKLIVGGHPQKGGVVGLPNKFTHIIFDFTDGSKLYFNDLRKFGWIRLVNKQQVDKLISEFGVEPFDKEYTLVNFQTILKRYPNRKIKQILMDQTLLAGVGNIYADESCFCAKILPTRVVKTLKPEEIKRLFNCIPKILKFAIAKKGTSADDYVQLDGSQGGMLPYLKVYGRKGEKCARCSGVVQKIKLNGRGTHFCKKCQK